MKTFFTGLLSGITITAVIAVLLYAHVAYSQKDKSIVPKKITINTISGEPSKIENATAGKESVYIIESHDGAGKSEMIIPYSEIPAANNWITKRKSISIMFSPRGNVYGIGLYRYDQYFLSVGFCIPAPSVMTFSRYDVFGGVGMMF